MDWRACQSGSPAVHPVEDSIGFTPEGGIGTPRFAAHGITICGEQNLEHVDRIIIGYAEGLSAGADVPQIGAQAITIDRKAIVLPNRAGQGGSCGEDFQGRGQDFRIQAVPPLWVQEQALVIRADLGIGKRTQIRGTAHATVEVGQRGGQPLAQSLVTAREPELADQLLPLEPFPEAARLDHSCGHELTETGHRGLALHRNDPSFMQDLGGDRVRGGLGIGVGAIDREHPIAEGNRGEDTGISRARMDRFTGGRLR